MRTRMDIASACAGPRSPSAIARSRSLSFSTRLTIMRRMRHHRFALAASIAALLPLFAAAQPRQPAAVPDAVTLLRPARVFDGETMHEGWAVRVKGERIEAVGPD